MVSAVRCGLRYGAWGEARVLSYVLIDPRCR